MKEILFRAFVKDKNKIFNVKEIDFTSSYIHFEEENKPTDTLRMFDQIKLMQFTGLTDKNGKQIFEGDIISKKILPKSKPEKMLIEYDNGFAGYVGKFDNEKFGIWDDLCKYVEVIGNIYDNPELLGGAE